MPVNSPSDIKDITALGETDEETYLKHLSLRFAGMSLDEYKTLEESR